MNHYQETNRRIAPQRRYTDHPSEEIRQLQASEGRLKHRPANVQHKSGTRMQWFSGLQNRIRTNPAPFFLIGSGLMIGIAIARGRQRKKRSILMRDFSGVAEEIGPAVHRAGSQSSVRIRKEAYLRAAPGTFKSNHNDQTSTEEIFRDQAGIEQ